MNLFSALFVILRQFIRLSILDSRTGKTYTAARHCHLLLLLLSALPLQFFDDKDQVDLVVFFKAISLPSPFWNTSPAAACCHVQFLDTIHLLILSLLYSRFSGKSMRAASWFLIWAASASLLAVVATVAAVSASAYDLFPACRLRIIKPDSDDLLIMYVLLRLLIPYQTVTLFFPCCPPFPLQIYYSSAYLRTVHVFVPLVVVVMIVIAIVMIESIVWPLINFSFRNLLSMANHLLGSPPPLPPELQHSLAGHPSHFPR